MTADQSMTAEQAAMLKRLAEAAYELETFQPNLTRAEADAYRDVDRQAQTAGPAAAYALKVKDGPRRRPAAKLLTRDEARHFLRQWNRMAIFLFAASRLKSGEVCTT